MAISKTRAAFSNDGATLTAGGSNSTSTGVDLTAAYGCTVDLTLTNGSTGPTVAAQVQIQVANDSSGTEWVNFGGPLVAGTTASTAYSWCVEIPFAMGAVRVVAGSNTGQSVTLSADYSKVTSV